MLYGGSAAEKVIEAKVQANRHSSVNLSNNSEQTFLSQIIYKTRDNLPKIGTNARRALRLKIITKEKAVVFSAYCDKEIKYPLNTPPSRLIK